MSESLFSKQKNLGAGKANIWEEEIVIPTYPALAADLNPMFIEKRVYQGSKGNVYPLPFTDKISDERIDKTYQAVFLENEYLKLMVLPEIGGRIHAGLDKTNGYDFIYHNHVIKPALVGLAGPWISGGIEFNWPQHHRPTTFTPLDHIIERSDDGSVTVWVSEIEPFNHLKGMAGITLHPAANYIEVKVKLYNGTPYPQTFLWWANLAVQVNEAYQAIFPPDVKVVADHAKRAMSAFPIAKNTYYGIDYSEGVDISWFKNIPVPTSYMALSSRYDFLGGYDHQREAGIIHVANHHISPGKKMWTWGAAEFGQHWYKHLTDADGPYIELMSGVYTDNQPDFSWLQPYETKSFSQYWYPIRQMGHVKQANLDAALNLKLNADGTIEIGLNTTSLFKDAQLVLEYQGRPLWQEILTVGPAQPFKKQLKIDPDLSRQALTLKLVAADQEIISYTQQGNQGVTEAQPAQATPPPQVLPTTEKLYLAGLHLEQYRHATYAPAAYYEEALRRDATDARNNNALGLLYLKQGVFDKAVLHFRQAIATLTAKNPNPYDGEPYYNLGIVLRFVESFEEAYNAFYKATWNYAWQAPAYFALAQLDCRLENWEQALSHIQRALSTNNFNFKAHNLKATVLRKLGRLAEAKTTVEASIMQDLLNFGARNELYLLLLNQPEQAEIAQKNLSELDNLLRDQPATYLDLAIDYAAAALWPEACAVLKRLMAKNKADPLVYYHLAYYSEQAKQPLVDPMNYYHLAAQASPDYCFPNRHESMQILQIAQKRNPQDARAPYYLGNLLFDKKQYSEAIAQWERSRELDPNFSIVHRNLGLAYFNYQKNQLKAKAAYVQAFATKPADARLLYELDQLDKRLEVTAQERLTRLNNYPVLVEQRDDLYLELVTLYNLIGKPETALDLLANRHFHPWEGGEGKVSEQYVVACLTRGQTFLQNNQPAQALTDFLATLDYPVNLGESEHPVFTSAARSFYYIGLAYECLEDKPKAVEFFTKAGLEEIKPDPEQFYYQGLAWQKSGDKAKARTLFEKLMAIGQAKLQTPPNIDYFATSLPTFLLFEDDLTKRNTVEAEHLMNLGLQGLAILK